MSTLLSIIPKTIPAARKALRAMESDIESAKTYEAIRSIERAADAMKLLFAEVDEVRVEAEKIVVLANHRIGAELAESPPARRAGPGRGKAGAEAAPALSATLKEKVGSKKRGVTLKRLGGIERDKVKAAISTLHAEGREATVRAVLKQVRNGGVHQQREEDPLAAIKRFAKFCGSTAAETTAAQIPPEQSDSLRACIETIDRWMDAFVPLVPERQQPEQEQQAEVARDA